MKKIFILGLLIVSLFGALTISLAPPVYANDIVVGPTTPPADTNPLKHTCDDLPEANTTSICANRAPCNTTADCTSPVSGSTGIISRIIQLAVAAAGVACVIAVIIGAFTYITSTGESAKVQSAKNTIMYALIGLLISVFAEVILRYVIKRF